MKYKSMINKFKCPDFQFNTCVDEFGVEKVFFNTDHAKLIFSDDEVYDLSDVELYILDDIKIYFNLNKRFISEDRQFDIEFESSDGWLVKVEKCYFHNFFLVSAEGCKVIITKGQCNKNAWVKYYSFIENLNLTNESEINKIKFTELDKLFLIRCNDKIFENIDGYFYTENTYNDIKHVFDNLYYLLKYYSAESASMRISLCLAEDFQKVEIGLPSKYSNFKYESCFYDNYPNTFFDFLNSAYDAYVRIKNEDMINVKLVIHYLAFIKREPYLEVDILISAIILEVLTTNNKKIKDSNGVKFASDLKRLIKELKLDFNKLDQFFKEYDVSCKKNTFLSEIVKARNDIVHGKAVISFKLNLLMTTFVNIIALKLFDINCAMYIPLIGENVCTKEFLNQFIIKDEEHPVQESNCAVDDDQIEVVEIDGELFLPLKIFDGVINKGDEFRLLEFETKEYGEECKMNLKMSRLVKQ